MRLEEVGIGKTFHRQVLEANSRYDQRRFFYSDAASPGEPRRNTKQAASRPISPHEPSF